MPQSPWSLQRWLLGNPRQIHVPLATPNAPVKMASNDSVDFVLSWKTFGSTENWDQMSNKLFTMVRLPWALDCCLSLLQPRRTWRFCSKFPCLHYQSWSTQFCFDSGFPTQSDLKVAAQWAPGRHAISIDHVLPAAKLNPGWNQHGSYITVHSRLRENVGFPLHQ